MKYSDITPRTDEEIVEKIHSLKNDDFFGFRRSDLADFLPLKEVLKLDFNVTPESFVTLSKTSDNIVKIISDYMPFAWGKANGCCVLSAGRSIEHMSVWLWLLGEDSASEEIIDYELYGKPQLAAICERLDIDWKSLDNGSWVNCEDGDHEDIYVAELNWN